MFSQVKANELYCQTTNIVKCYQGSCSIYKTVNLKMLLIVTTINTLIFFSQVIRWNISLSFFRCYKNTILTV